MAEPGITIVQSLKRVRAVTNGRTIADTLKPILLIESGAMPVYYIPREDVTMERLQRSGHKSQCPLKGEACYWTLTAGGRRIENAAGQDAKDAVWSYLHPLPECPRIAGHFCFYPEKVRLTVEGES